MEAVLSTTELLEAILLNLDITTLLVSALRVNKTWNSAITHSLALQRALYFQPIPGYQELAVPQLDPGFSLNPLLVKKFAPLFFDFINEELGYIRRANSFYALPWTPTAFKEFDVPDPRKSIRQTIRYSMKPAGISESGEEAIRTEQALRRHFTRKGASWRRMLVFQPPPSRVRYFWVDSLTMMPLAEIGRAVSVALVDSDPQIKFDNDLGTHEACGGLRMGQLYDLVQQHAGHHHFSSTWFRVSWGRLREPFYSDHCRDTCRDLLSKAGVVVEFVSLDERAWWSEHRDPPGADVFDRIFRCDEHCQLKFGRTVVTAEEFQIPSDPGEARVIETTAFDALEVLKQRQCDF